VGVGPGRVNVQNGDSPQNAAWCPPPRNQSSNLQKITVGAKITGFRVYLGQISGNQSVIIFAPAGSFGKSLLRLRSPSFNEKALH
jgi:hypothetical protein